MSQGKSAWILNGLFEMHNPISGQVADTATVRGNANVRPHISVPGNTNVRPHISVPGNTNVRPHISVPCRKEDGV